MDSPSPNARRKILGTVICAVLTEHGYDTCEKQAMETLTEMLQCFITEVGHLAKNYCELTGRSEPIIGDIVLALIDMGITMQGLEVFAKRSNRAVLPPPQVWQPQKQLNMLQAGVKQPHPNHVPTHLPAFPHPHAYIRTPTHKQPVTEYEAIREKSASQKRDMERALTRFLARTGPTNNLFQTDDSNIYPLIACKRLFPPYISALLPQDQIFDPEDLEYDARDDPANQQSLENDLIVANRKRNKSETVHSETSNDNETPEIVKESSAPVSVNPVVVQKVPIEMSGNPDIDNPYLRATKMPRKKLITKINVTNNTCSSIES